MVFQNARKPSTALLVRIVSGNLRHDTKSQNYSVSELIMGSVINWVDLSDDCA